MPVNSYDNPNDGSLDTGTIVRGPSAPDSAIEDAAVATGIPAASLDIYLGPDSNAHSRKDHVAQERGFEHYDGH